MTGFPSSRVHEHFFVRDDLWNFRREEKAFRRFLRPSLHSGFGWRAVEGAIYLDGIKMLRVIRQVFTFRQTLGIEGALPACSRECGSAQANAKFVRHLFPIVTQDFDHSSPGSYSNYGP